MYNNDIVRSEGYEEEIKYNIMYIVDGIYIL